MSFNTFIHSFNWIYSNFIRLLINQKCFNLDYFEEKKKYCYVILRQSKVMNHFSLVEITMITKLNFVNHFWLKKKNLKMSTLISQRRMTQKVHCYHVSPLIKFFFSSIFFFFIQSNYFCIIFIYSSGKIQTTIVISWNFCFAYYFSIFM